MANQFSLQNDDVLDPQLEAMTSPAHYVTASKFFNRYGHYALQTAIELNSVYG